MDENILQRLSSERSQECQLIDLTLGKLKKLRESELAILGDLYREDRWRWTPEHGLQVGLPQDLQVRWFSRESVWDLQNRIRPLTLPDGDPDPNADRRLKKQEYVWLLSQMLHYKLGFALSPIDAAARIAAALRTGNVQQPHKLKRRAQKLRREYHGHHSLRSTEVQLGSAVNEETSRFDGESEGEQELEDGVSNDGRGRAHSSVESGLERLLASGNVRADREAGALGPVEKEDSGNVAEACPDKRKTPVMASTTDTNQTQGATRSNLCNLAQRSWVSHFQTLKPQDPLPPVARPVQFDAGTDKHAKETQTLPTPETDASAPPRSHDASIFGSVSERVDTDNTRSITATRSHRPGSSIDKLIPLKDDDSRQDRRPKFAPEGVIPCPGDEARAGSLQCDVLRRPHKAATPLPRTGMKYLTNRDTDSWPSKPDSTCLLQPKHTAPTTRGLEQIDRPRVHPPVSIVIEDSDDEHHPEHSHRPERSSIGGLKRRKPLVKVANASSSFYSTRSIFSIPPSDIDGDDGTQLFSRQRSLSSAPSRISAMFPQMKRSAANPSNKIKNRIPAKVTLDGQKRQSNKVTPDGSQHGTNRGIQRRGCESRNVLSSGLAVKSSTDLEVCRPSTTQSSRRSKDNSDPSKQHPLHHVNTATPERRSRREDTSKSTTVSNVIFSKTKRAPLPSRRNLSALVQPSTRQQGNLDVVGDAPDKLHSARPNKKASAKKEKPPKKAKCPGQQPRMTETTLTSFDIYALNAKVETGRKNIDKVVEELRHSSQTFASSVKTPHKNKRSHATAFTERNSSITRGRSKQNMKNPPHELVKRKTSGALKSPIPRAPDVTIFPRLEYIMGCDENGVPAERAPFRQPTPLTHTIRDQVGNPLPRTEKPLAEILKYDQEQRRRDPIVRTNYWSRFPKPSPPRNGRWICHKQLSSAKMPLRGFWPKR